MPSTQLNSTSFWLTDRSTREIHRSPSTTSNVDRWNQDTNLDWLAFYCRLWWKESLLCPNACITRMGWFCSADFCELHHITCHDGVRWKMIIFQDYKTVHVSWSQNTIKRLFAAVGQSQINYSRSMGHTFERARLLEVTSHGWIESWVPDLDHHRCAQGE